MTDNRHRSDEAQKEHAATQARGKDEEHTEKPEQKEEIRAGNATPNLGRIDKAGTDAGIVALAGGISSRFLTLFSSMPKLRHIVNVGPSRAGARQRRRSSTLAGANGREQGDGCPLREKVRKEGRSDQSENEEWRGKSGDARVKIRVGAAITREDHRDDQPRIAWAGE